MVHHESKVAGFDRITPARNDVSVCVWGRGACYALIATHRPCQLPTSLMVPAYSSGHEAAESIDLALVGLTTMSALIIFVANQLNRLSYCQISLWCRSSQKRFSAFCPLYDGPSSSAN